MSSHGPDDVGVDSNVDVDGGSEGESVLEIVPAIFAVGTLGIGMLTAALGYFSLVPVVFIVGWFLLTPLSAILGETKALRRWVEGRKQASATHDESVGDDEAALEQLKRRYARGKIDEVEFERRTATLLENDSIEDVQERVQGTSTPREREHHRDREREHHRDREREREGEYAHEENPEREYET